MSRVRFSPEARSDLHFPVGNYALFYKSIRGGIEVVRVLSAARDIPSLF